MHFFLICFFSEEIKAFFVGRLRASKFTNSKFCFKSDIFEAQISPARLFTISLKFCIFAFFLSIVCAVVAMLNSSWNRNNNYSFVIVDVEKESEDARKFSDLAFPILILWKRDNNRWISNWSAEFSFAFRFEQNARILKYNF